MRRLHFTTRFSLPGSSLWLVAASPWLQAQSFNIVTLIVGIPKMRNIEFQQRPLNRTNKGTDMNKSAKIMNNAIALYGGLALFSMAWAIPAQTLKPKVIQASRIGASPSLRELPISTPAQRKASRLFEIPRFDKPFIKSKKRRGPLGITDPVVQNLLPLLSMPAPINNFEGISNNDNLTVFGFRVLPPDTNMDVGPNHIVQAVNILVEVYDKAGNSLLAPVTIRSIFTSLGSDCATTNSGNPIVQYDPLADRWLISQFTLPSFPNPPYHECIAISQTPDPTGAYYLYKFTMPNSKLNDYPKFGVWPDGYYMSANQFTPTGVGTNFSFSGVGVAAFDRTQMLSGGSATMIHFDLLAAEPNAFGLLPADLDGSPPPAGTPNYFTDLTANEFSSPEDSLRIFDFHADFTTPANSSFTARTESPLPTAAFDPNMCVFLRTCIPQPSTAQKLDAMSRHLMYRLQYRNFGTYESLTTNHTVDVGADHAGIRYYELRRPLPGGSFSIHEQSTFAPDADHRWMGSAALDKDGNLAVGYSVSSTTTFPSIRYAGRLATDAPGGLAQGETTLQAGAGSQTSPSARWGEYSMMAVDPTDDCTFWYTTEYFASTSDQGWQTRIGSFKFPSCGTTDLSLTKSNSPDPVFVGNNLTYTITATNNGPSNASGVVITDTLPANVTLVSATSSQGSCSGTATVSCNLGNLNSGANATATIVVTPTAAAVPSLSNTASVSGTETDPTPGNNSASATHDRVPPVCRSVFNQN